jgi:hypothetical protein
VKRTCATTIIYRQLWPFPAWCGFTCSEAAFQRHVRRLGAQSEFVPEGRHACVHRFEQQGDEGTALLVCFGAGWEGKTQPQVAALACHEALHVFDYLMVAIDEEIPGDHLRAYYVQGLTQWMLEELEAAREVATDG